MSYFSQMVGARRAQLHLGGRRHLRGPGAHPRHRPPALGHRRQLLGGPDPRHPLRAAADLLRRWRWCWSGRAFPQTLSGYGHATGLEGVAQTLAWGPMASQEAIKELGTNGGGFLNANSAHPFENPTPFTNFLEMLAILCIPAGAHLHVRALGRQHAPGLGDLRRDERHLPRRRASSPTGRRSRDNPALQGLGIDQGRRQPGGQGDALRRAAVGALRRRHHRHLLRRRQLDAR